MDEIRIETTNKKTQFSRWNISRKSAQKFTEDPKIRVAGKDISLKEYQNNNAVDCNIYEIIEKYRGDLKLTAEMLNQKYVALQDELTEIKTLPDAIKQMQAGEKAWKELPLEIRAKFGYSVQNFIKNGANYVKNEIKSYNDAIAAKQAAALKYQEIENEKLNATLKGDVTNG